MKTSIIIPSRLASTRLPEKALADIFGKSLIMRVYLQACKSRLASEVIVATDHAKIYDHISALQGKVVMTSSDHQSGTDRVAEVAQNLDSDIIINVQGDEPLLHPGQIDQLIQFMIDHHADIATQCQQITDADQLFDYNVVKVVKTYQDKALYFSRQAIPAVRDKGFQDWLGSTDYYRHIGMYGFKKDTLMKLSNLEQTKYEKAESLEQLRWMQHGFDIHCMETAYHSIGVDTPEDLEIVREMFFKEMFR